MNSFPPRAAQGGSREEAKRASGVRRVTAGHPASLGRLGGLNAPQAPAETAPTTLYAARGRLIPKKELQTLADRCWFMVRAYLASLAFFRV